MGFQNHALVIGFTTWLTRLIKHPSWDLIAHKTKSSGPKNLEMSWNDIKSWIPPKSHMKQNRKLENTSDLWLEDDVPVGSCSTCQISSGLHQPEWVLKNKARDYCQILIAQPRKYEEIPTSICAGVIQLNAYQSMDIFDRVTMASKQNDSACTSTPLQESTYTWDV